MDDAAPKGPEEEEQRERYRELLEEFRTIIPGVQVLFAFLLTVPFSQRFEEVDDLGRDVFAASILGVALATICFMTPAVYHRLGPRNDRSERLRVSFRLAIVGMSLLALSVPAAIFVVVRFIFDATWLGLVFGGAAFGTILALWFLVPLTHRRYDESPSGNRDWRP